MNDDTRIEPEHRPWSRRGQEVGAIVWSSFLAACFATLVFFAFLDPVQLANDEHPPVWLSSAMAGYAMGFFFFWIVCAVAALLTAYLLDTLPPADNIKPSDNVSATNVSGGRNDGGRTS